MRKFSLSAAPFTTIVLLTAFFGGRCSEAVLDGDPVVWGRHGFLVKVLARNPGEKTKSCTGSLISASLVLTARSCVTASDGHRNLEEFVVQRLLPPLQLRQQQQQQQGENSEKSEKKPNPETQPQNFVLGGGEGGGGAEENDLQWYSAQMLRRTDNWALLRIPKQNTTQLCDPDNPGRDRPRWVSRLNLNPSLRQASLQALSPGALAKARCYLLGFRTTEDPIDFARVREVFRLDLEKLSPTNPNGNNQTEGTGSGSGGDAFHFHSKVSGNFTACFDDSGAPLICRLVGPRRGANGGGDDIQVGVLQWLKMAPGRRLPLERREHCTWATEMEFALTTTDNELVDALEQLAMSELVDVYKKCNFS